MLCSLAPSEVAGRVVLGDREDLERERRHQSASACTGGDMVVMAVCTDNARLRAAGATVESECILVT